MYHVNLPLILTAKIFVNFLTTIKYSHFLVAIADLTHPLSNNRSSIRIIGCYFYLKLPPFQQKREEIPA